MKKIFEIFRPEDAQKPPESERKDSSVKMTRRQFSLSIFSVLILSSCASLPKERKFWHPKIDQYDPHVQELLSLLNISSDIKRTSLIEMLDVNKPANIQKKEIQSLILQRIYEYKEKFGKKKDITGAWERLHIVPKKAKVNEAWENLRFRPRYEKGDFIDLISEQFENVEVPGFIAPTLSTGESYFTPDAKSKSWAIGAFQLTRYASPFLHIDQDPSKDERYDPVKSSYAAAKMLKENFDLFGSWMLAITTYNGYHKDYKEYALEHHGGVFSYEGYLEFISHLIEGIRKDVLQNYEYKPLEEQQNIFQKKVKHSKIHENLRFLPKILAIFYLYKTGEIEEIVRDVGAEWRMSMTDKWK